MYLHGYTNPKEIIFDFAKVFCTGNRITPEDYWNNWKLIYPNIFADSGESYPDFWESKVTESEMNAFAAKFFKPETQDELAEDRSWLYRTLTSNPKIVLKCMGKQSKVWRKKVVLDVGSDTTPPAGNVNAIEVALPGGAKLAANGSIRVMIEGKKYSLYRVEDISDVKVIEFYIQGNSGALVLPSSCANSRVLVDFEQDISAENVFHPYYLQLERPTEIMYDDDSTINGKTNYFYLTWKQGEKYDEKAHENPEITQGSITNTWVNGASYGIGDRIQVQDTVLNKVRFFQCKQPITQDPVGSDNTYPTSVVVGSAQGASIAKNFIINFPRPLYDSSSTGAPEMTDDTDITSLFTITSSVATLVSAHYKLATKSIEVTLSADASNGDQFKLKANSLWDDNNNVLPEFELTYNFSKTAWDITAGGNPIPKVLVVDEKIEHTPENVKPITGLHWRDYWDEIYVYNPEPAWLEYKQVQETKWSWYKCNAQTVQYVQDWLPIEYWMNINESSCVCVLMGDPGMSATDYISSPAYFGQLEQIEGALETDDKGNFACFSGSDQAPQSRNENADISGEIPRLKKFGDYTATGTTDIMLAASKSGRPFQGHKVGLFGMYEFKEQTFNGQSSHTDKSSVTDIVVADVHENERGILKNCIGVPKLGKEHGVELVADRYIANKEKTYIFLKITAQYTPFNTSNDVLIGLAIRTDN